MRKVNKQSENYKTKAQLKKERKEIKNKSKMEKKFLVGLYDDYRKNGVLNCVLNKINCNLIGSYSTEPIYTMYDIDGDTVSCAVELNGINSIKVEVWEIDEKSLNELEKNYNYYPDFEEYLKDYPQDYIKEKVLSPYGEITMYFTNVVQSQQNIIIDGDWIEYLNYVKATGNKKENVL